MVLPCSKPSVHIMRFALFLFLGLALTLAAGIALAGSPGDQGGVTVLRGSSAPPPPPSPPATSDDPTIVQREIVYVPYPGYLESGFVVPGFVVSGRHRPFNGVTTTPLPNGWPLFQGAGFPRTPQR